MVIKRTLTIFHHISIILLAFFFTIVIIIAKYLLASIPTSSLSRNCRLIKTNCVSSLSPCLLSTSVMLFTIIGISMFACVSCYRSFDILIVIFRKVLSKLLFLSYTLVICFWVKLWPSMNILNCQIISLILQAFHTN